MRMASRIAVSSSTTRIRNGISLRLVHESGQSYQRRHMYNPARMQVVINRDPKLSKIDHLFVILAENSRPDLPVSSKPLKKLLDDSGFVGRSDEFVTTLADEPKKITLVGAGKEESLSIRSVRAALCRVGRIAKAQRDVAIAVVVPYVLPKLTATETTRLLAIELSQVDYKYDAYITVKKDEKAPKIDATLVPLDGIDSRRFKHIESEANAIAGGVRLVRELGNA